MRLKQLFKDIPVVWKGSKEIEIQALTLNSQEASPGCLFVVKKSHKYIPDAVAAGAVAILTDTFDPFVKVTQIIHHDIAALEPILAERFYPIKNLEMIGVTGTSGKTTTTYLLKYLLQQKYRSGLVGTVEWITGKRVLPASYTTPDLFTLRHLLHEMEHEGCNISVMEVSSHGIDQGRVKGIPFEIGIYTNLSQDHLDYHKTMEEYAQVKAKLFHDVKVAIINHDDEWSKIMTATKANIIRYGLSSNCDLFATEIELSSQGIRFRVHWRGESCLFETALIGRFNIYNILAATAAALMKGLSLEQIAEALLHFPGVPGRLERVINASNLQVFVDYSHKPDALKNVLQTLSEFKQGKIITVFGCGGNRDMQKRPLMASIAEAFSDHTIVTNDNPRQEDPEEIVRQIISGFKDRRYSVELDRKKAIEQAINQATPSDIVLIAGKGHEPYQIFAHQTIRFDDREVAREVILEACRP